MKSTIGEKLIKLRGCKSRKEVADAVRISVSTLQMYENGQRVPRDEIKLRIAKYYDVSVEWLFFEQKEHEMCPMNANKHKLKPRSRNSRVDRKIALSRKAYTQKELEYICKFYETDGAEAIAAALNRTPKAIRLQANTLKRKEMFEEYKRRYDARLAREDVV